MIKFIVFDLDGVLVDTKNLHFAALNDALKKSKKKYQIKFSDHLRLYDGLPTKEKLNILIKKKYIFKDEFNNIYKEKQKKTASLLKKQIKFNKDIYKIFLKLSKKYSLAIATNSIKKTLNTCIRILKIKKFLTYSISTNDTVQKKPHPEIYLRCLVSTGFKPSETLILEDSHVGRVSANQSGCNLMPIKDLKDVNFKNINNFIKKNFMTVNETKNYWEDHLLNILIPMAGAGSRFEKAGYTFPKPLIEVHGKPMIQWVIEGLKIKAKYIFIVQKEHNKKYNIKSLLNAISPKCEVIEIEGVTEGAACTTLLAKNFINNNHPLVISNSDQFIEWDSSNTMYKFTSKKVDGGILVFNSLHPKWSFAKTDKNGYVTKVAEKEVISNQATVGVYYWRHGKDYVKYTEKMIKNNTRVNNEFYVCPVFNEAIKEKKIIITEKIEKMWGLGTPEDLNYFLQHYKI